MARVIVIKIYDDDKGDYIDGAIVSMDDNGDLTIDGQDFSTMQCILELWQDGLKIDGISYDNESFMDGLLIYFKIPPWCSAKEVF